MVSIQTLREHRAQLVKASRHQLAEKGGTLWSADDQETFDDRDSQIEALTSQIESIEKALKYEAEEKFSDVERFRIKPEPEKKDARGIFTKMLRFGPQNLTPEENFSIRNTMSTTTGSEGGYTVQSEIASQLINSLKAYGGVRQVASSITTAQGNPLSFPTSDGTSEVGEWVAENVAANALDVSFGTVAMTAFKSGSKIITIPYELLVDSSLDIIAMLQDRITTRIGRLQNAGFTTGGGSTAPRGFVTGATTGKTGTTGQTTTVIYDDLIDLQESVDEAYQTGGNCRWMMNQATRKVLRKLKDENLRPIWTDSWDAGGTAGISGSLLGQDVIINNDMAVPGASAKTIAYGDFSKYMVRNVMDITLFRFDDSAFASKGQVGFLAWSRAGGNLLDSAAIKLYVHSGT
jgi:HK97 family phage major capsid protein